MRARSIKPSDDSPFVNEIFNTDFTDYVFNSPEQEAQRNSR
jgi:L-ornithine N5-oxygenase